MGTEGWYNDEADPAIARWYDGTGWTSHTMVKAEWAGPGEPPPPDSEAWFVDGPEVDRHDPALYATVPGQGGKDHYVAEVPIARTATITAPPVQEPAGDGDAHGFGSDGFGSDRFGSDGLGGYGEYDDDGDDLEMWGARPVGAHFAAEEPSFGDGYEFDPAYDYGDYPVARAGIDWSRYAAPLAGVAALVVALLAFQLLTGGDDGDPAGPAQSASAVDTIEGAVERARQGLAVDVTDGDLKALIRGLCDVAAGGPVAPVAGDAAIAVDDPAALTAVMSAAARGAAEYCPANTAAANGAVDDVVAAAGLQITTTTVAPVDTTQVADAGSASSTGKKSSTASGTSGTTRTSNGGVVRTESRSQSSTSPTGLTNNAGSPEDKTAVGNQGQNNQSTSTVITAPPTTPSTTAETTETTP